MLPWKKAVEFASDLVQYVFLLNLIIWKPEKFSTYKTRNSLFTDSMKKKVNFLSLALHEKYSPSFWSILEDMTRIDYSFFIRLLELEDVFEETLRLTEMQFLSDCIAISYLGLECYHLEDNLGPYYAVMAIVDKYRRLYECGLLPDFLENIDVSKLDLNFDVHDDDQCVPLVE